jgi:hypothetical protein
VALHLARDLARSGSESCALVVPDNTEASDFTAGSVYGVHFHYWGEADGLVCPNVQTVPPSAGYLKTGMPDHPQVTKGPGSWLGLDFVEVPSLRRRSVGPR